MAPETRSPPGQAWQDAQDPVLLGRLWRRAERPGLARPWQAQAMLARHRRMAGGLPLAELLQRRAELLADGHVPWAPIVYARPATTGPPWAPATPARATGSATPWDTGAGRPPGGGHGGAVRAPSRPVVRATAARAVPRPQGWPPAAAGTTTRQAPGGESQAERGRPAATAAVPGGPSGPGRPAPPLPLGLRGLAVAAPGAGTPGTAAAPGAGPPWPAAAAAPPGPPVVTPTAGAGPAVPGGREAAPPPGPARPVVEPARTARPPGGLVLVTVAAAPPPAPGGVPPVRTPSSLPVVRPEPGRNGQGDRPAPWQADAPTGRAGAPALPVVGERAGRGRNGAWAAPAGVPAPLPLAPAPAAAGGPAGAPAAPTALGAGWQPPPGPGTPAAAVPAARGSEADRGGGRASRRQAAPLAPVEIDRIADRVQRKLLHRLAIEGERRGAPRWR
ncbi:MAG TPA: hypothetical protein VGM21_18105 [Actinomycetota bacterium]|jgi:hypothetical protein